MNVRLETKISREDEINLHVKYQLKVMCNKCVTYGHTSISCTDRKEKKYCTYCNKYGHMIQECNLKNRENRYCA